MSRGDKRRWLVAGAIVASAVVVSYGLLRRAGAPGRRATAEAPAAPFRGLASGPLGPSAVPDAPPSPDKVARDVAATLSRWRAAIVAKDAGTVIELDQAFRQAPERFAGALAASAEKDDNERVRAFSTRVLGKLDRSGLEPLYQRLLADKSPFVRQNAAWALGQLGGGTDGRAAAAKALPELRHVRARDPAGDVRLAAKDALGRLE